MSLYSIKKKYFVLVVIGLLIILGTIIPSRIAITVTPSVKHRIFIIDRAIDKINKGDYIMFMLTSKYIENGKPQRTIKRVSCIEGEKLVVVDRQYFCNGESMGYAKDFSLKGERLENFKYNGVLPKGAVFVVGDHKDSYDSRYTGFLNTKEIKAIVHPIF